MRKRKGALLRISIEIETTKKSLFYLLAQSVSVYPTSNVGTLVVSVSSPIVTTDACAGQAQPRQGIYKWYGRAWGDDVADFTITTAAGSNYFIKLEDLSGRPARAFFVNGGSSISNKVPLGTFVLKYASGNSWCNERDLFGADTATNAADETFTFDQQ